MPAVWERSRVRQFWGVVIPKHFDNRLWLRPFKMTKTTFQLCFESSLSSYDVPLCKITWLFWCASRNLLGKCDSIRVYACIFFSDKEMYQYLFMCFFRIYARHGVSIQHFLCDSQIGRWKCFYTFPCGLEIYCIITVSINIIYRFLMVRWVNYRFLEVWN